MMRMRFDVMMSRFVDLRRMTILLLLASVCATVAYGQPKDPSESMAAARVVKEVGIDQKLDSQVPLDLVFKDETGRQVKLGDYFGSKPVILTLAYYECPMLCTMVLNGVASTLKPLSFDMGKEFEVVTVSINPKETPELAAKKKVSYIRSYGRPGAERGWHFLTGDEENIRKLADAVGFRYVYDPNTGQYAHAGGMMILTPEGKLARYFYGVEYPSNDVRLGLVEASQNKIGSPVDQVLLLCYHYDPVTGRYGLIISRMLMGGGILTLGLLGGFIFVMLRRDRQKKFQQELAVGGMTTVNGRIK